MKNLIIFFLFISGALSAQNYIPYYNVINEADFRLISQKDYAKAEKLYLDAFKIEKPFERDYFQLARCYAGLGDSVNMIKYLKLSSTNVIFNPLLLMRSKRDSILFSRYSEQDNFRKCIIELKQIAEKHKDILKNDSIMKLKKDTIHYFLSVYEKDHKEIQANVKNLTTNQKDSLEKIAEKLDIEMRKAFFKYVEEHGFPDYSVPGSSFSGGDFISLFLSKLTEKEVEKYEPMLLNELKKGNLLPYNYGFIIDRAQIKKTKDKCLMFSLAKNMTKECWEIQIEERKKIGLSIYLDGTPQNILIGFNRKFPWVGTLVN